MIISSNEMYDLLINGNQSAINLWEENFEYFKKDLGFKVPEYNEMKRDCAIYDLDGTLYLSPTGTHWYERDFENDIVVEPIAKMIKYFSEEDFPVFVSGRQDKFREATEEALGNLGWKPELNCHLFMRKTGDQRDDTIVKEELFWEHVYPLFNVKFVVDDREKVCRLWKHKLRFYVFNVNQLGTEF